MQINDWNFLRWFDAVVDTAQPLLPYAYWKDKEHCGYMPVGYPTEALSFYINTLSGISTATFSDFRLGLVNASTGTLAASNIATLNQHFVNAPTNTLYNIYSAVVIPTLPNGVYYFKIYRNSNATEVLRSSYVLVRNDKTALDTSTIYCKFRHDRYFYGIKYHELPSFYQQFRLNISVLEEDYDTDEEQYKEVTTGINRSFNSYMSKFYKMEAYYFDPAARDATAIMLKHSYLELNGREYTLKSGFKPVPNQRTKLNKGEFEVWDKAFSSANLC